MAGKRLANQAERAHVERRAEAAERRGHDVAEPARPAQPTDDVAAGAVEIVTVREIAELAPGPSVELIRQTPVIVVEEGPLEESPGVGEHDFGRTPAVQVKTPVLPPTAVEPPVGVPVVPPLPMGPLMPPAPGMPGPPWPAVPACVRRCPARCRRS